VFEAAGGEINISVLTVVLCNLSVKVIYGLSLTSFVKWSLIGCSRNFSPRWNFKFKTFVWSNIILRLAPE